MEPPEGTLQDHRGQGFRRSLLELLVAMQRRLISEETRPGPLNTLQEGLLTLTGAEWCMLALPDASSDSAFLTCRAAMGEPGGVGYIHNPEGLSSSTLRNLFHFTLTSGQLTVTNTPTVMVDADAAELRSLLVIPVTGDNETRGALALANRPGGFQADLADALEPVLLTLSSALTAEGNRTRLEEAHEALARESRLLEAVLANMGDALLIMDCQGRVRRANHAAAALFGFSPGELASMQGERLVAHSHRRQLRRMLGRSRSKPVRREIKAVTRNGDQIPLELSMQRMEWNRECYLIATAHDISERLARNQELTRANRKLERLARTDPLTGVHNRRAFQNIMEQEFRRSRRHVRSLALIMVDVDHFKLYNDLLGHDSGDQCLRRIAELLKRHFRRAGEMVARVGGEEFAIVVPECSREETATRMAALLSSLRQSGLSHPGQDRPVSLSAGLAMRQPEDDEHRSLVRRADRALYQAKADGRDMLVVHREEDTATAGH